MGVCIKNGELEENCCAVDVLNRCGGLRCIVSSHWIGCTVYAQQCVSLCQSANPKCSKCLDRCCTEVAECMGMSSAVVCSTSEKF